MRIQHNIMSMNAYRNYTNNVSSMQKNLERLSSGYKINRAGDDAAGLAISEKMRAQITGLETAQKNAKDGISLVQTAEGALTEVHDMLNRMVELATQSANGTYEGDTDRLQLQKEIDQLKEEIDRIADSANFNGIKLLNGNLDQGGRSVNIDGIKILDEGGKFGDIGDKTILKSAGAQQATNAFAVDFLNLKIDATDEGGELSVKIGDSEIKLTLAAGKVYEATDLADLLKTQFETDGGTFGKNDYTVDVSGTRVTFTQASGDPDSANYRVDMTYTTDSGTVTPISSGPAPATESSITGAGKTEIGVDGPVDQKAIYTIDLTGLGEEQLDTKTIDGVSISWDEDLDTTMEAFVTAYNQASKDYTASYADGVLTLTQNTAGTVSAAPQTTITDHEDMTEEQEGVAGTATIKANASGLTNGAIKTAADKIDGIGSGEVTIAKGTGENDGKLVLMIGDKVIGVSDEEITSAGASYTFKDAEGNSLGTVAITGTLDDPSSITETLGTGITYTAAGGGGPEKEEGMTSTDLASASLGIDFVEDAEKDFNTIYPTSNNGGQDELDAFVAAIEAVQSLAEGDIDVDFTGITDAWTPSTKLSEMLSAISKTIADAVDEWNKTYSESAGYHYNYKGLSSDGTTADIMPAAGALDLKALIERVNNGPEPDGSGTAVSGNYAHGTVEIVQGADAGADLLASTTFDLADIFGSDIGDGSSITINGTTYTFKWGDSYSFSQGTITLNKNSTAAERLKQAAAGLSNQTHADFVIGNETGTKITISEKGATGDLADKLKTYEGFKSIFSAKSATAKDETKGLTLQIGDTADSYNQLQVSIYDCHVAAMGISGIDITTQTNAADAVDKIKDAINYVSDVRGTLGATQNRLDHTINNLSVMTENIQDAESTIRDTDIAEEMMSYTKNNILIQAAQAMLAQANQVPQGVLQLLQ